VSFHDGEKTAIEAKRNESGSQRNTCFKTSIKADQTTFFFFSKAYTFFFLGLII
jgi:hypothetical protein